MRDLYKRLGIDADAPAPRITASLDSCPNAALKADAMAVLSVSSRRDDYDALHRTLYDIGRLRARLGLTHGEYWQGSVANDFTAPADSRVSRYDDLTVKITRAVRLHNALCGWRRRLPWLAGTGALLATLGAVLVQIWP
ncbi:hypothetical protein GCM10027040_34310 [Halomonas shantousis]